MALSFKNPEVERLARELAAATTSRSPRPCWSPCASRGPRLASIRPGQPSSRAELRWLLRLRARRTHGVSDPVYR